MRRSNLSRMLQSPVFTTLVRFSPRAVFGNLLRLVIILYFSIHRDERRTIKRNLEEVFGNHCDRGRIDRLLRSTLKGISLHYFEKLFLAYTTDYQWKHYLLERIRIVRKRNLDRHLTRNKGVILVTAHFGAVEFLPGYLALLGYPVAIVAKFKTKRLREKCREKAESIGARIVDAEEKNSLFSALAALREGRVLITQCDEVECWKPDPQRAISLFGTSFQLDRTVTLLQKRSGASVVFGHVSRIGNGRYLAEIEDISGLKGFSYRTVEEIILERFENLVYTRPDQWYIWKSFQHMKAPRHEGVTVEDRTSRDFPVAPAPLPVFQLSQGFSQLHGQYCSQGSI